MGVYPCMYGVYTLCVTCVLESSPGHARGDFQICRPYMCHACHETPSFYFCEARSSYTVDMSTASVIRRTGRAVMRVASSAHDTSGRMGIGLSRARELGGRARLQRGPWPAYS